VGIEVVKDPSIIFLDEPTTGLDSEMALGVITSLKAMAKAGKMVRTPFLFSFLYSFVHLIVKVYITCSA
jgi:ABC-type multidrug transport system ATPase subunit